MKQLDQQRYLWLLRVFIIFLIISIFTNIILFMSFEKISPIPKREVFFVNSRNASADVLYITDTNTNNQLNISQDTVGYEIAEKYISTYIINRETVYSNPDMMRKIWGKDGFVFYYSSKSVYDAFLNSPQYIEAVMPQEAQIVNVQIETIIYHSKSKEWKASILKQVMDIRGRELSTTKENITLKGDFSTSSLKRSSKNKWENPLGFEITEYRKG